MIELNAVQNETRPVVVCDKCGAEIEKFDQGVVLWDEVNAGPWVPTFVHKNRCDDRKMSCSMELTAFVKLLGGGK